MSFRSAHDDIRRWLSPRGTKASLASDGDGRFWSAARVVAIRTAVAAGADPDAVDADGRTLLWHACRAAGRSHPARTMDHVLALLDAGADRDHADHDGDTPLDLACMAGSAPWVPSPLVRHLVSVGARPSGAMDDARSAGEVATALLSSVPADDPHRPAAVAWAAFTTAGHSREAVRETMRRDHDLFIMSWPGATSVLFPWVDPCPEMPRLDADLAAKMADAVTTHRHPESMLAVLAACGAAS